MYDKDTTVGLLAALLDSNNEIGTRGAVLSKLQDEFYDEAEKNFKLLDAWANLESFPKGATPEEKEAIVNEAIAESESGETEIARALCDVIAERVDPDTAADKSVRAYFR